ncbi:GNAT family N-acetyltransferase [Kytococcus sedentarius]|uniref:GNAT family N-acetyltransferase n=1 Tax=Kytococcus sedentarius TaxID=1276 RepID=UPI0035BBBE40
MPVTLRPVTAADEAFLRQMLVHAAFWRAGGPPGSLEDIGADPRLAHYVDGWPRAGDLGVLAESGGAPVGAAWVRQFGADDPGYGFVDTATPELSMGVAPTWRGRGVGGRLLDGLLTAARDAEVPAVSLSVEVDNHALRLYRSRGFVEVGESGNSITMLRRL